MCSWMSALFWTVYLMIILYTFQMGSNMPCSVWPPQVQDLMMENTTLSDICFPCVDSIASVTGLIFNFLFAVPANSWVLRLMMTSAGFLTDKMEVFEFKIALNELLFCLITPVFFIGPYLFRDVLSKSILFLSFPIIITRPLFQCCICLDRYMAVIHPVVFLRYKV